MVSGSVLLVLCGSFFQGTTGIIYSADETPRSLSSPNYPLNYPNNFLRTYMITSTRPGYGIAITFDDFRLESSTNCAYDFFEIYEGDLNSWSRVRKHCGYSQPDSFYSPEDTVYIKFKTDSSSRFRGWSIRYYEDNEDPFDTGMSATSWLILYICLGIFIPIILIIACIVIVYVCGHAGRAKKRTRVNDMRVGQQQLRSNAINSVTVSGASHPPISTVSGYPMAGQSYPVGGQPHPMGGQPHPMGAQPHPMQAPPPYDAPDYYGTHVPPPFNYIDPSTDRDQNKMFAF